MSLSDHLRSLCSAISTHEFLVDGSNGRLPRSRLALYLAQDRIYAAHAYPRFVGRLIAAIPFSSTNKAASPENVFNNKILKVLAFSLDNVVREVGLFDELCVKWGFDVDNWQERKGTRDYTAEMTRVSAEGDLFEGLVFLYAMELIYLESWRKVRSRMASLNTPPGDDPVLTLAENWTSEGFEYFVQDLKELVDAFDVQPGSSQWTKGERIWERVVELEDSFWPNAGEETILRK